MWICKLVDFDKAKVRELEVGDMFWGPTAEEMANREVVRAKYGSWVMLQVEHLSDYYKANNSNRSPLFVKLPGNTLWCVDGQCWSGGDHYGGWTVTGDAPNVTVQPSINIGGSYHGWLIDGIISADCEGRLYEPDGTLIWKSE